MLERFGYKNLVAAVYIAALFMQIMDGTIINVALPTLADEFRVDTTAMDWTVLSFTLALGVMTASAGWFGQRLGLRRAFLIALAIYGTTRQIAPAIGVAIASTVLANGIGGSTIAADRVGGYQNAVLASALMFGVAAVLALRVRDRDATATMAPS